MLFIFSYHYLKIIIKFYFSIFDEKTQEINELKQEVKKDKSRLRKLEIEKQELYELLDRKQRDIEQ